jgi:hypothetical protein
VSTSAFDSLKDKEDESLPRKAKSNLTVCPDVDVQLIPKVAVVEAKSEASRESRKREAEEPLYLSRV